MTQGIRGRKIGREDKVEPANPLAYEPTTASIMDTSVTPRTPLRLKSLVRLFSLVTGVCGAVTTAVQTFRKVPPTVTTVAPYLKLFLKYGSTFCADALSNMFFLLIFLVGGMAAAIAMYVPCSG